MVCIIKVIITLLGVSQQDVADAVDVSRNTISHLARNKSIPNLQLAYDIRDFFNKVAAEKGIEQRWTVEDIWIS